MGSEMCIRDSYIDADACVECGQDVSVRAGIGLAVACVAVLAVGRYLALAGSSKEASARLVKRDRLYNKLKSKWRIVFVSFQIVYSLPNLLHGVAFPRLMRVQFEALRDGNALRQNDILGDALKREGGGG